MKAIQVKYLAPTNHRGSRLKAIAEGVKPLTLPFDYELSGEELYKNTAVALCERQGWSTELLGGAIPNGDYVFVFKHQ